MKEIQKIKVFKVIRIRCDFERIKGSQMISDHKIEKVLI
jgi:hypothetical protein